MSTADRPAAQREERKVLTALFADLVGSTALSETLDPEEVKLVVGEAVARIVREVERLGGYVKDLAGDGVLAFFGAPVASEDDVERAVRVGLRVADEIGAYGREVEEAWGIAGFGVRVGIATGPVVLGAVGGGSREEYAAFGETVNRAARLQSAADPGAVLVDDATARDLEGLLEADVPASLTLKGLSAPVLAHRVLALRAGPHRRGRPLGVEGRLVGRDTELLAAGERIDQVLAGTGGVLVILGEAGIGKSRLLAELRARFTAGAPDGSTPTWLEGRCVSYGESLPLWPIRDLLRGWLGVSDEPDLRMRILLRRRLETLFGDRAGAVYPYLGAALGLTLEPEAQAQLGDLSPEAAQYRTFEVVSSVIERLAADGPVVVVVEDAHWADPTSVELVERLVPVAERSAVLLVLSHRADREHPTWALRERVAREFPHLLREVALEPLSGDAERELLRTLTGGDTLPAAVADRLLAQVEGNPFFLEELVRSLADAGALVPSNGAWRFDHDVPLDIPPTVERVIVARLDRLDPACHRVVTAAAVLGRRFGQPLLAGVTDEPELDAALHELQRLDLVRPERRWPQPEYRFKHALIQEAAYRLLVAESRTALHRRAAEWLERAHADSLDEVVGLLAHHWLEARDEEKAVAYLTRAADRARNAWALDEAIDLYRQLIPILERRGERQAVALVHFKLGLALHTALRFAEANATFQRAFEAWDRPPAHPSPTETLRVVEPRMPRQPDPPRSYNLPDMRLQMALFDRLVERWPEATIVPSLAEHWEVSDDGLRYRFRLREGVEWSDGTPLTAHDVEFGIKRGLDPARPGISVSIYYVLEGAQDYAQGRAPDPSGVGVRALDDRVVEFRLAAPAPYFLSVVNRPDGGPVPQHAIGRHGDGWILPEHQVVSGAFRQVERSAERIVLERRPETRRPGNVSRVEIVPSLEALGADPSPDLVIDPAGASPEDTVLSAAAGTAYLAFDHRHPVAGNLHLRRALALAFDRSRLAGGLPAHATVATGGLVPPALQGHTPEAAPHFDPVAARAELHLAGNPGRIVMAAPEGSYLERLAPAAVESWRDVLGDLVSLRLIPWDEWVATVDDAAVAQIWPTGWFPGYPDPEYFLRLLLHSESTDNGGRWRHPPFDELIERARRETDGRTRLELFHSADRMAVAEQVAVIPLAYVRSAFAVAPRLHGWWEFGKSWSSYADLIVEEPDGG